MQYHINWDKTTNNGVIFNDRYNGAMYLGDLHKPDLGFDYHTFWYSEKFATPNHIIFNDGLKRLMTVEEEAFCRDLAINWMQPYGHEGNEMVQSVEITIQNGNYVKHTSVENNVRRGISYIDPTYNVLYENMDEFGEFNAYSINGVKSYKTTPDLTAVDVPVELVPFKDYIIIMSDGGSYTEYYFQLPTSTDLDALCTATGLSSPYTAEQATLLESDPYIFSRSRSPDHTYSVSLRYDGTTYSDMAGYLRGGDKELMELFNINVNDYTLPEKPTFTISPRQVRLQLSAEGKLDDVQPAIDSLPEPDRTKAQIEWEYATKFEIWHPFIIQISGIMGLERQTFFNSAILL